MTIQNYVKIDNITLYSKQLCFIVAPGAVAGGEEEGPGAGAGEGGEEGTGQPTP